MTLGLTPYVLTRHRPEALYELRTNPLLVFIGGLFVQGTYLIVLTAMVLAPVSYIVPLREVSVLFGTMFGMLFLKEVLSAPRLLAALVITIGVVLIAVLG